MSCTQCGGRTIVLVMFKMCTTILDESLGATVLSLSNATSPTCVHAVPAALSSLSFDFVLLSLLLLFPSLSWLLLLGLLSF